MMSNLGHGHTSKTKETLYIHGVSFVFETFPLVFVTIPFWIVNLTFTYCLPTVHPSLSIVYPPCLPSLVVTVIHRGRAVVRKLVHDWIREGNGMVTGHLYRSVYDCWSKYLISTNFNQKNAYTAIKPIWINYK